MAIPFASPRAALLAGAALVLAGCAATADPEPYPPLGSSPSAEAPPRASEPLAPAEPIPAEPKIETPAPTPAPTPETPPETPPKGA